MILTYNGLILSSKDNLFDTKVGVYTLIKKNITNNVKEKTGAKRARLEWPAFLKEYNRGALQIIIYTTIYHLTVDSR